METLDSLQLNADISGIILPNTEPPQTIIPDSTQFSIPGSSSVPLEQELVPLEIETNNLFAEELQQEIIPNTTLDLLISNATIERETVGNFENTGTGLTAEYFDTLNLINPIFTRTDATVDFNWGLGSPHPAIEADSFSVRWTGQLQPLYTETYSFHTLSNDGVRLWVNGELLIDQWIPQDTTEHRGTISLEAGQLYDIKLEYYERNGNAVSQLLWSSDSQNKEIIPTSVLYPSAPIPETPSHALELQFLTDLFYNPGETVDFVGKVSAEEGTLNLERIDFSLQTDNGEEIDIIDATEFTTNLDDPNSAFFNYQLNDLQPGRYQLRAVTVEATGTVGEPIRQNFTVLSVGEGEELSDRVLQAIAQATNLDNYTPEQLAVTQQWVVSVKDGASYQQLANDLSAQNLGETGYIPNTYFWDFSPETDPQEIASRLSEQLNIEFAYPLVPLDIEFFSPTDEPNFSDQWYLQASEIPQVWDTYQGDGVVVGVVDDGFDLTNPDLAPNYLADLSFDFDQQDNDPSHTLELNFSQEFPQLIEAGDRNKYPLQVERISGVVSNIAVALDIKDVDIEDLEVFLISPEGTKEELSFTGNGSGVFATSTSAFNGENPNTHPIERNYKWTLEIEHENEERGREPRRRRNDDGILKSWDLTLETSNSHGTSVAGIAAARGDNEQLGTGVAPEANWVGLRLGADGFQEDEIADVLSHENQEIDIYNNSWGHGFFNTPLPLVLWSFEQGTEDGRDGLGSIYVFAAGNDGHRDDNVNYNSFANSRHNIAVAAIDSSGKQAFYSNPGAPVLISAYSNNVQSFFASPEREDEFDPSDPEYDELFLRRIRDNETFFDPLVVSGVEERITDVTVNLNISHRDYQDLEVVLISPSGTEVELFADVPFTQEDRTRRNLSDLPGVNPSISLNSSAQRTLPQTGVRPTLFLGTFQPSGDLTNFVGENANGTWQLKVTDNSGNGNSSNNQLKRWSLNISTSGIITTDIEGAAGYTTDAETINFGGTSASAPLVSGVIALMLEANPNLSWREVQQILIETADKNDPSDPDWTTNGAGYPINHQYGFGAINAEQAVEMAEDWYNLGKTLNPEKSLESPQINVFNRIPDYDEQNPRSVSSTIDFEDWGIEDPLTVESVEVHFKAFHSYRGDLEIVLVHTYEDPETGEIKITESVLAEPRGDSEHNYDWWFTTARHWGEPSTGEWTLRVSDLWEEDRGIFQGWKLNLFGSGENAAEVAIYSADPEASESGDLGKFSVTLNEALAEDLTVEYAIEGTALNGVDYGSGNSNNSLNDTVVIPAGTTEVMIPIEPVEDEDIEGNETLILRLLESEDYQIVDEGIATITIADNDVANTPPTLTQIDPLTGAVEFIPLTITYAYLQGNSNATDVDNDAISFQIESVTSGTLYKDNVAIIPGETLLGEGEEIIWIPESAASGLPAFTVKVFDGIDYSDAAVEVAIDVDAATIPSDSWIRQLGTVGNDEGHHVTVDGLGNVYVASTTAGNLDNGNAGGLDAVLSKYDADGNLLWTEQLGSGGDDVAQSVAVDAFGNLYLAGHTNGSLPGFTNPGQGRYNTDSWIAKYSSDGSLEWIQQLEIPWDDVFYDLEVDTSGNIQVSGHTWSPDFAGPSAGKSDALIVEYNPQGNLIRQQKFGTPQADTATGIALDEEGNLYMTGWSATFNNLDPENAETLDVWVAKHDAEGNTVWTQTLGVSGQGDTAWDLSNDITIDSDGNVYIAGYTAGDLISNIPIGDSDVFVAKYNNNGVREWIRQLGTLGSAEHALSVAVDSVGNVRVAGFTDGDLDGQVNSGGLDAFLTTFDGEGNPVSTELVGTAANDYANGVAADRVGNVYLTGYSEGDLEGANAGNQDIWVSKNYVQPEVTQRNIVTNTNDSGAGSLRDAIIWANNNPGRDTILFDIPGEGPHTISATSALPNISEEVLIDGWSQNGETPPDTPLIELSGINAGTSNGLTITGSNVEVRGLVINGWQRYGIEIRDENATDNWIYGNFIGTNKEGTGAIANTRDGIYVGGNDNIIGTNGDGTADTAEGNLISGNSHTGVDISGDRNIIAGNIIGTNLGGTEAISNTLDGVYVRGNDNIIGTDGDGIADTAEGNLISGNSDNGVRVRTDNNIVAGNLIGTNLEGTEAIANHEHGIVISSGNNNIIGTNGDEIADEIEGNLISGNSHNGVVLNYSSESNILAGNRIGTNLEGTAAIANGTFGIEIWGAADNNIIGTNGDGIADEIEGNLISGNSSNGVWLLSSESNVIAGNRIGTNLEGTEAIANGENGIAISRGANNIIGTNGDGIADEIEGNLISGNSTNGVALGSSDSNVIAGNHIGTNLEGTEAIANSESGIVIASGDSNNNTIGGTSAEQGNVIAFNDSDGILLYSSSSGNGNRIQGNSIFSNAGLGIDLNNNGVTANDIGDSDTGVNNLQNFPELTSATSNDSTTTIQGTFNSTANTTFTLELFSNSTLDESGYGQGETFLSSQEVTTDSEGNTSFTANIPTPVQVGHFITATATDPNGNTSEFSQGVEVNNQLVDTSWTYVADPNYDSIAGDGNGRLDVGSTVYEIYGMAIKEDADSVWVALNANLPITGHETGPEMNDLPISNGNIGWGDLFFDFSGVGDFEAVNNANNLFAVRFAGTNDSRVASTGVYSDVKAVSVVPDNAGWSNLWNHNNLISQRTGNEAKLGELAWNDPYYRAFNSSQGSWDRPESLLPNVIESGTKVGDIEMLDTTQLFAAGLDLSNLPETGSATIGFKFDKSVLPSGDYLASLFTECNNDGVAIHGSVTNLPSAPVDLESLSFFPTKEYILSAGDNFNVRSSIANNDPGGDAGAFDVAFYLSEDTTINASEDYFLGSETVPNLAADSNTFVEANLILPDAGDTFWNGDGIYTIGIIVDSENAISETNENNNANTGPFKDYADIFDISNTDANLVPVASNDLATLAAGTSETIAVLANDFDPDGDSLTLAGVGSATSGDVSISNSDVVYTPNVGFVGTDNFTYSISDGRGGMDTATVSVIVEAGGAFEFGQKFLAPDGASHDQFGWSVAIDGNYALIGSHLDDDNGENSGSAYLFDITSGDLLHKFIPRDGSSNDRFGFSLALNGDYALIGSSKDDGSRNDSGSAYLFNITNGRFLQKFIAPDSDSGDEFGNSVALSGDYALIGSSKDDDHGNDSGSAYLFDIASGDLLQKFIAPDAAGDNFFGYSVALNGNYAVIGSYFGDNNGSNSGSAYLFDITSGDFLQKFIAPDPATADHFGVSVALDGDYALIGSYFDDDNGYQSGSAYLFDINSGDFLQKFLAPDGAIGDAFGVSVALNGNYALIGSNGDDDNGNNSGSAYLFDITSGDLLQKFLAPDGSNSDNFGKSVALNGNSALISSYGDDDWGSSSGSAYLFAIK